jgi:hypothetical protein
MDIVAYRVMKAAGTLPKKKDRVRFKMGGLSWEGIIVETFYENGEGGMHVKFDDGYCCWVCCTDVDIVA